MLFKLAHIILHQCPRLWEWIEDMNSFLFYLLYGRRLKQIDGQAGMQDAQALTEFFQRQPEETFQYFRPHAFDLNTIKKMLKRHSIVMHVLYEKDQIIGYCFLRCYFIGKAYRGYIVDITHQGKGFGKTLNSWLTETGKNLHLRAYTTINKKNIASFRAAQATATLKPVSEMDNGDVLYECLSK